MVFRVRHFVVCLLAVLRWDPDTDRIYAVVLVHDPNQWFTEGYQAWDAGDRIEVFCQGDAEGGTGWDTYYDVAQQYMVGPNTLGDGWATWGWGQEIGEDARFEFAVKTGGDMILYEIGVGAFHHYGGLSGAQTVSSDLQAGDIVGFDILVDIRWADNGFGMLSENLMTGKSEDADKFARYLLVDQADPGDCKSNPADLDRNCTVDAKDIAIFAENWLAE